MQKRAFVSTLLMMSLVSLLGAVADQSLGWLLGSITFALLFLYARKLLNQEKQGIPQKKSSSKLAIAVLILFVGCFFFLYWLQEYA